jgi:indole-3-glycerol phosphate synthase
MQSFLDTILLQKREEVTLLKRGGKNSDASQTVPPRREFVGSLEKAPGLGIIAEVKKASPSKGVIRPDFDPVAIARSYERAGADAVSVLTDERFFQGSLSYLLTIRNSIGLPVLRKDFIIDIAQVEQTAAAGADAILLIAAILDKIHLRDLYEASCELGVQPLIEVHHLNELDRVMTVEPNLLGVNNRDLATFVTDTNITLEIVKHIPGEVSVVSESGIENGGQAQRLSAAGVRALLVGESLMRQEDPSPLLAELRGG